MALVLCTDMLTPNSRSVKSNFIIILSFALLVDPRPRPGGHYPLICSLMVSATTHVPLFVEPSCFNTFFFFRLSIAYCAPLLDIPTLTAMSVIVIYGFFKITSTILLSVSVSLISIPVSIPVFLPFYISFSFSAPICLSASFCKNHG